MQLCFVDSCLLFFVNVCPDLSTTPRTWEQHLRPCLWSHWNLTTPCISPGRFYGSIINAPACHGRQCGCAALSEEGALVACRSPGSRGNVEMRCIFSFQGSYRLIVGRKKRTVTDALFLNGSQLFPKKVSVILSVLPLFSISCSHIQHTILPSGTGAPQITHKSQSDCTFFDRASAFSLWFTSIDLSEIRSHHINELFICRSPL